MIDFFFFSVGKIHSVYFGIVHMYVIEQRLWYISTKDRHLSFSQIGRFTEMQRWDSIYERVYLQCFLYVQC